MLNMHGLSRHIPAAVSAEVRHRSKNGCVICRALVYDYEHIEPEFKDALEHDPAKICLLCPEHHAEVTRGRISKAQVRDAYEAVQAATNLRPPFHNTQLSGRLTLGLGNAHFEYMPQDAGILKYDGETILRVGYVEDATFGGSRPSISGTIFDVEENELIKFDDNRITLHATGVDVLIRGSEMKIIAPGGAPVLKITFSPPNGIQLNCLRMKFRDLICELDETFGVTFPTYGGAHHKCLVSGLRAKGVHSAISYTSDQQRWASCTNLNCDGGVGIQIPYSGVTLAAGAGEMIMPQLEYVA